MNHVDPDIQHALQSVGVGLDAKRAERVRTRQKHQGADKAAARIETMVELLSDEVEAYVPRKHPAFLFVLSVVVARKIQRQQQEPEFTSDIEAGWPSGW